MVLARKQAISVFLIAAATIYTAIFFVSRSPAASVHPGPIGIGAAFDLLITAPCAFYFLLVRPGYFSWTALLAVFLTGARAAGFLLPVAEQAYLPPVRWMGVPLELWALITVARRFRQGRSAGTGTLARLLSAEFEVFYYALFSWRAQPETPPGYRAFPVAEASGFGMLTVVGMLAVVFEGVPTHLLLQRWSHTAAWIWTAIDLYALLWLVALRRSVQLRPFLVGRTSVTLQVGLLWRIEIARNQIANVRRIASVDPPYLRLTIMNEPQWLIELKEPVVAHGLLGLRKMVTRIGVAVDDASGFAAAMLSTPDL